MNRIQIEKPSVEKLKNLGIESWSQWSCGKSTFEWEYGDEETCYIREGRAKVKTQAETVEFGKGDLVTFPKGLKCTWEVLEPVRKVYSFGASRKP